MKQKTKANKLMVYLFGICLAFSNISCSGDEDSNTTNLGNGDVSGIVTDDKNAPLEGVTVTVNDADISDITDASGSYNLKGLPIGKHILTFSRTDYQTVSCTLTSKQFYEGTANISTSLRYAAAKITGKVLDAQNGKKPLEGASVSIGGEPVLTNSDGIFTISQLPLDNYTVTITYNDYNPQTRDIKSDDFVDGVAQLSDILMGGEEILPGLTLGDLKECTPWMYNEYRGGRNADNYPQFDWSVDYMCTLDMVGNWEEQNEGTTMRVNESNGVDLDNLNTFIYGRKHITEDNKIMTVFARTHQGPAIWNAVVVDLSEAKPQAKKLGENISFQDGNYKNFVFDLSAYVGKDIAIAIGTYYSGEWVQLVLRRISFAPSATNGLAWLPGTPINEALEDLHLTQEMVRGTMPNVLKSFTGITTYDGRKDRDEYVWAYRDWNKTGHVAAYWGMTSITKDCDVFTNEGYTIKTRGGNGIVSTSKAESYLYSKFAIDDNNKTLTLRVRNFGDHPTYYKLIAITDDMNVKYLQPTKESKVDELTEGPDGTIKFNHKNGDTGHPENYGKFVFDLSQYNGQNVTLVLAVYKGEENGDENKVTIYSIDLN
ncbi:carboxypeptidase regulatory-like domain-containing protein [Xylanibacter ruminicola]|uniref:Carboxypeptidase regulatory-like domain-containing protein n=1 Tax=Xylanibacter ruminicola TaxID=839 RepID=A0A1M6U5W7_XYLRU|nr:carboxypeptidase regulatory-like domain-containing protein [Xylanibacter ruminicola]SHK64549.1 Carboxypeptidase regulatory-like domain-containing protein [Xylanibacter ruminicola]